MAKQKKKKTSRRKKGPGFSTKESKNVFFGAMAREFVGEKINEQFPTVQLAVPFGDKPKALADDIAALAMAYGIYSDAKWIRKYRALATGFAAPQLADLVQRVRGVK